MNSVVFEKETVLYQGLFLAFMAALATALLLFIHTFSEPTIKQRVREDQMSGLNQVLPAQWYQNDILATEQTIDILPRSYQVFTGTNLAGDLTAYAIQGQTQGYAGPITYLVGVSANGDIIGVRILAHAETPGLGDKIEIKKSKWVNAFNQLSLTNTAKEKWAVKKDGGQFDQFTGATITPRAVVAGVYQALSDLPVSAINTVVTPGGSDE